MFLEETDIGEQGVADLLVLDAGCGPARLTRQIAQHGARTVVGLDLSETVNGVFAETRDLTNLEVIQADLTTAPLRAAFDLVWSAGVIHHTADAAAAFRGLTRYVRPGGMLYVWVYPSNLLRPFRLSNAIQATQAALGRLGLRRLPESTIFRLAGALSYATVGLYWLYRAVRRLPGVRPHTPASRESVKPIARRTFHNAWYDALVPPYTSWHSEREVIGWFRVAGFTDITTTPGRPLGVHGRAPLR
jgi:SAM-dependent methyltransferase